MRQCDWSLGTFQFIPPNRIIPRSIIKVTAHLRSDVAIGAVASRINLESNQPLTNKALTLTSRVPLEGDSICTWAYPNCVTRYDGNSAVIPIFPRLYEGQVRAEYGEGRDSVMLPGRCYETNLGIHGGASGGPVFDAEGYVFAINSTGIAGDDISYVSHVQSLGGLPLQLYQTEDGVVHPNITISQLIDLGHIVVQHVRPR